MTDGGPRDAEFANTSNAAGFSIVLTTPVGLRARRAFGRYVARRALRDLPGSPFYVQAVRPIMFLIRACWCLIKFGPEIAKDGRPLTGQAQDMLQLAWRDRIDPICYPMLELYRPERRDWIDHVLSRFEVGNGLLKRLHKLRPTPHGRRINLGDKLAFHTCCRRHGIPSPKILLHATKGRLRWLEGRGGRLPDRDLFVKPRQSRGARHSFWLRRIAPFTWISSHNAVWSYADVLAYLRRRSRRQDFLLQVRLWNHREIADLADESLIAIRIFTAMDAVGVPVVTHAMLRVLSKLEPRWPGTREYAAAVDLHTGVLSQMCNDKDLHPGRWTSDHPMTGAAVRGRQLALWPEVRALAESAHRVFSDRMVVGWDIAVTPEGPVVLEGNSYPDVHFLQRVHCQPIGHSPLGPLLQNALDKLEHRDREIAASNYRRVIKRGLRRRSAIP